MSLHSWKDFRLYVITGENYHTGRSLVDVMEQTLLGGADMVQLRAKDLSKREVLAQAYTLRKLTDRYNVPLIINDYLDVALAVQADGVHLGQDDLPLKEARRILGPAAIIGISTHHIDQALDAERDGADYIGVGPVYPTGTKAGRKAVTTDYVREVAKQVKIPWVAIGGITLGNVGEVIAAGASRVCAVSAIVGSEHVAETCRSFRTALTGQQGAGGSGETRTIRINGRNEQTNAQSVHALMEQLGFAGKRMVVELNGVIIAREAWHTALLEQGASLELVHFVGGG